MMATALSALLLLLGIGVVALNGVYAAQAVSLRRRGDRRHVSLIYAVPQLLVWAAAVPGLRADPPAFPAWLFVSVALADVSLYWMIFALVAAPVRRFRSARRAACRLD